MATFSVNDMFMGTMEDDVLWGGMGDDTLQGGAGDDRLIGGPGADSLDGGPGSDTADYAKSDAGVHVDLSSSFGGDDDGPGPVRGGHAEGDTLQSIENIWGSSYSDKLIGNHVANMLFGRGGNDQIMGGRGDDSIWGDAGADDLMGDRGDDMLFGGDDDDLLAGGDDDDILMGQAGDDDLDGDAGDDILEGGMGDDDLDGGSGSDTAAYTMSEEGVTIDLGARGGPSAKGGDAMGDTLDDIENVRGSMHDDMLTGDGEDNKLYGNQGDDELMGGVGNDMLRGGKGDDEIEGGVGDDKIYGDKGDDTLTGNGGDDTFVLREGDGDDVIEDFDESGNDTIQLGTSKLTSSQVSRVLRTEETNRDGTYTYEWEDTTFTVGKRLTADDLGAQADRPVQLTGDGASWPGTSKADEVNGSRGDDTIYGGDGDDTLRGRSGDDMLSGGRHHDTLEGERGNDTLTGGDGHDTLNGGDDNDDIWGGRGNDMLSGGGGNDIFRFYANGNSDTITDFHEGDVIALDNGPKSDYYIGRVLDTEEPLGDGSFRYQHGDTFITVNQQLTPADFEKPSTPKPSEHPLDDQANEWGESGGEDNSRDDLVMGNGGDDTLHGGEGNDTLKGGDQDDTLNGDAGDDSLYGDDGMDMLSGGAGNDMLMGGDDEDTLKGDAGNDKLYGGDANDTLMGGDGDDTLMGGDGDDRFEFGARDGSDTITGFEDGDKIALGSNPESMMSEDDIQDVLDDEIPLGNGMFNYQWRGTDITVDHELELGDFVMQPPPEPSEHELTDRNDKWPEDERFGNFDNSGPDYVDGDGGRDIIKGGDGNDTLRGGDHDDSLQGEDGDDHLYGDIGDDTLMGGDGDDMLYSMTGTDGTSEDTTLDGGAGTDTLSFENSVNAVGSSSAAYSAPESIEKLIGSDEADTLEAVAHTTDDSATTIDETTIAATEMVSGGEGNDTLTVDTTGITAGTPFRTPGGKIILLGVKLNGDGGDDSLTGGGFNDTLDGGAGNDSMTGGAGNDSMTGGAGNDTLDGGNGSDTLTGGAGSDTFTWGDGDTIEDFTVGEDERIVLPADVTRVQFDVVPGENAIRATLVGGSSAGESMTLRGVTEPTSTNDVDELFTGGDGDLWAL